MAYNSHIVVTEPLVEWITLADAKAWLKVDHTDDDDLITALLPAVRKSVEHYMRRKVLACDIVETWMQWPGAKIELYWSKLNEVTAIKYIDEAGDEQTVDSSNYFLGSNYRPPFIMFGIEYQFPAVTVSPNAVTVEYSAGWADADSIPGDILVAMKLVLSDMYENRTDTVRRLPTASMLYLQPYNILES